MGEDRVVKGKKRFVPWHEIVLSVALFSILPIAAVYAYWDELIPRWPSPSDDTEGVSLRLHYEMKDDFAEALLSEGDERWVGGDPAMFRAHGQRCGTTLRWGTDFAPVTVGEGAPNVFRGFAKILARARYTLEKLPEAVMESVRRRAATRALEPSGSEIDETFYRMWVVLVQVDFMQAPLEMLSQSDTLYLRVTPGGECYLSTADDREHMVHDSPFARDDQLVEHLTSAMLGHWSAWIVEADEVLKQKYPADE